MSLSQVLGELDRVLDRLVLLFTQHLFVGGQEERSQRSCGVSKRLSGEEVEWLEVDVEHSNKGVGNKIIH